MAYGLIDKSGCEVWHGGLVSIRFDLFLEPDDARYDERYTYVPVIPECGYPGLVDKEGSPVKQSDYDAWLASLPHYWRLAPFHSHFLRFEPDVSQEQVEQDILFHIPNFYKAWTEKWDKEKGGMRHGWDVATRTKALGRPKRYDKEFSLPELGTRPQACLDKLGLILASNLSIRTKDIGETFPSTDIDIGPAASDRAADLGPMYTWIDLNNPANDTGTLDTIEIWTWTDLAGVKAGTFSGSGTSYDDRDYESIGAVTAGAKRTFTGLDCDVTTGDFIGGYWTTGRIEHDGIGFAGIRYKSGDQFGTGVQTYSLFSSRANSLYGTGETAGGTNYPVSLTPGLDVSATVVRTFPRAIASSCSLAVSATVSRVFNCIKTITTNLSVSVWGPGWLPGWDKRIKLTIDSGDIDAALSNFPIMVYLSASSGITSADVSAVFDELTSDANRKKIAVTLTDGTTECYVEIEKWDDANEKAWLHVKVSGASSIASGADTELYLYYDSDHADNTTYVGDTNDVVAENVWDANFKAVYHMADGVDNAHIYDSTSNDNDGTKKGANEPNQVAGQVGYAQDFDGSDDRLAIADAASIQNIFHTGGTIEALIKPASDGENNQGIIAIKQIGVSVGWWFVVREEVAGFMKARFLQRFDDPAEDSWYTDNAVIPINTDSLMTVTYDASAVLNDPIMYFNGAVTASSLGDARHTGAPLSDAGNILYSGNRLAGDRTFDGSIDELRLSKTARSASWIKATKESLWDSLITFGAEEVPTGISRTVTYTRATISNLTASATVAFKRGYKVVTSTALSINTVISRAMSYTRATSPGLTIAATVIKSWGVKIVTAPGLTVAVSILRVAAHNIITNTSLSISATIDRAMTYTRSTSAGLTAAVSVAFSRNRTIITSTALSISATIDRAMTYTRSTISNLIVSVAIFAGKNYDVALAAAISVSAAASRVMTYTRATTPGLTVAVSILKSWGIAIVTSANLTVVTTIKRITAYTRCLTANLSASVTVVKAWASSITTNTNLAVSATVNRVLSYVRPISPGLTASVTIKRVAAYTVGLAANLAVSVAIIRSFSHTVRTSANLVISATVTKWFAYKVSTSTNLTVSAIIHYCRVLREIARVAIGRMSSSRLNAGRISHWRKRRTCE